MKKTMKQKKSAKSIKPDRSMRKTEVKSVKEDTQKETSCCDCGSCCCGQTYSKELL